MSNKATVVDVRKGSPSSRLGRAEFEARFLSQFANPQFSGLAQELRAIAATAWNAYDAGRKAGQDFADPDYDLAVEWSETRNTIRAAEQKYLGQSSPRILLINGSPRTSTLVQVRSRSRPKCAMLRAVLAQRQGLMVDAGAELDAPRQK